MTCGARHWFTYYGHVGSSSPTCVRYGCDAPHPRYDPHYDPGADPTTTPTEGDER